MYVHRNQITFKLKGVFLDRIFSLLRDKRVPKVHGRTLCEIFSSIRANNQGWRFFLESVAKLHKSGEADELFFNKALSIV